MKKRGSFNWRAFTSFMMFMSFTIEVFTGIILYIVPPGRVAHWTNWRLLWLEKSQWEAWHTVFGYVFLFFGILHIIYNWKPLMHYLKSKAAGTVKNKKEIAATIIVVLVFTIGSIFEIPPVSYVYDLSEYISESWENKESSPPVPHAERLTVEEFSKYIEMKPSEIFEILKKAGVKVSDQNKTIEEIAQENNMTPSELFKKIKEKTGKSIELKQSSENYTPRRGYGRMTLKTISIDLKIPVKKIIETLSENGIKAKEEETLKEIADKYDKTPYELFEIIKK